MNKKLKMFENIQKLKKCDLIFEGKHDKNQSRGLYHKEEDRDENCNRM